MADIDINDTTLTDWLDKAGDPDGAPAETLDAAEDVLRERRRQIVEEGRTPAHDDQVYGGARAGELAQAAGAYALHDAFPNVVGSLWPWLLAGFKPRTRRENCVRAAALLFAEIEMIDRAAAREAAAAVEADSAGEQGDA